jgi:hypothetical protein
VVIAVVSKLVGLKPYGSSPEPDAAKKRVRELWSALNKFVIAHGGCVTSVPGTVLRIECPKDSALPVKLSEFGYDVRQCGRISRVVGDPRSPFEQRDIIEITIPV